MIVNPDKLQAIIFKKRKVIYETLSVQINVIVVKCNVK